MRFVKCEIKGLNDRKNKKSKVQEFVLEFLKSGLEAARIEYSEGEYVSPSSAVAAINNYIKRHRISGVKAAIRDYTPYIFRVFRDDCE